MNASRFGFNINRVLTEVAMSQKVCWGMGLEDGVGVQRMQRNTTRELYCLQI